MWTIAFFVYLIVGIIFNIIMYGKKWRWWKGRKEKAVIKWMTRICIGIGCLLLFAIASYIFGFIWYYFCGGRLLFMDLGGGWFDKLLLGAGTLLCFGFLLSGIVIIFKK